jgi:hypothetical protein
VATPIWPVGKDVGSAISSGLGKDIDKTMELFEYLDLEEIFGRLYIRCVEVCRDPDDPHTFTSDLDFGISSSCGVIVCPAYGGLPHGEFQEMVEWLLWECLRSYKHKHLGRIPKERLVEDKELVSLGGIEFRPRD